MGHSSELNVELGERDGHLYAHASGPLAEQAWPLLTRCLDEIRQLKPLATRHNARVYSLMQPPIPSELAGRILALSIQRELSRAPFPSRMTVSLASECPCRCWASIPDLLVDNGRELNTQELKVALGQALDLGVVSVHFCGGEPHERADLVDIIDYVDPNRAVTLLYTNGLLLTKEKVHQLANSSLHAVVVLLDSEDPAQHDSKRGMTGLFDTAVTGLKRAQDAGLLVGIATVADQRMIESGELTRLLDLARELGVSEVFVRHSLPGIYGSNGARSPVSAGGMQALERLAAQQNANPALPPVHLEDLAPSWERAAGSPSHHLFLTAKGSIFPWNGVAETMGSLRKHRLDEIWSNATSSSDEAAPRETTPAKKNGAKRSSPPPAPSAKVAARERIGLLAGSGHYPIYFAQGARQCGYEVVALAIEEETDPRLADFVDEIHWVGVGLLGTILETFRKANVNEVVLTGKIHKIHLFNRVQLDDVMKRVIASLPHKDDVSILMAIIKEFERAGISVREPTAYLKDLQAKPGVLTQRVPTEKEMKDAHYGFRVAKDLANHGIGQTVVVRDGVIIAVEAIEGTDKAILRAASLVKDPLVVVKVGCPNQDRRFDMPVVGMETLRTLVEAHVSVLAIDAENTVFVDRDSVVDEANRRQIAIVAI